MNAKYVNGMPLARQEREFARYNLNLSTKTMANWIIGCAVVYSITETALLNGLKPYVYLTYVLDQIRQMGPFPKPEELDRLLPWSDDLPDEFRTKNQG